ncbi:hypothetical protein HDU76_006014 [Blyttiomyces sp. JEL0837]|nr:hypothetical protein HDU76_006014 [Blyttiomyces sp. JEL0837]
MMSDADNNNKSLREEFQDAQKLFLNLENSELSSTDPKYQASSANFHFISRTDVAKAMELFERCARLVQSLSMFSSNEEVEDINTSDLRFLLVEFYLGELELKRTSRERLESLVKAKALFDKFLLAVETHGIITPTHKKHMASELEGKVKDPARRRLDKIERYKREKQLKETLAELAKKMALTTGDPDEEEDREFLLLTIDLCIGKAIDSLKNVLEEKDMLERISKMDLGKGTSFTSSSTKDSSKDGYDDRVAPRPLPGDKLLSKDGKPMQPFVIMSSREQIKNQVFRPGHNLPTMTIDQFLENEIARGNFLQGGGDRPEKPIVEDTDEAQDAETLKARNWDNFKDDNPRGWGNRAGKG